MSPTSPNPLSPSRKSISNWLKHLKRSDTPSSDVSEGTNPPHLNLNDSAINDDATPGETNVLHIPTPAIPISLRKFSNSTTVSSPSNLSQQHLQPNNNNLSNSPTPTRPFLGLKSSSSHSFRPLSQFLDSSFSNNNSHNDIPSTSLQSNSNNNDLKSHRDSFILQRQLDNVGNSLIFGCDIETSTKNAYGTIYISSDVSEDMDTTSDNSNSKRSNLAYGKVPLVIVSCGSYLKSNALNVEGIFRVAGSNKRIKHLQIIFSTAPDFGAKINWEGYTVHDAASLLRRYLSSLSDPLIPFSMYDSFRNALIEKQELLQYFKEKSLKNNNELKMALKNDKKRRRLIIDQRRQLLKDYSVLFSKLPPIQRRVLFYLVDMLAMFDLRSAKNRMPAKNLAAIFQPSILFHPSHDMDPDAYAINSLVIETMITYAHKILTNVQSDKCAILNSKPKKSISDDEAGNNVSNDLNYESNNNKNHIHDPPTPTAIEKDKVNEFITEPITEEAEEIDGENPTYNEIQTKRYISPNSPIRGSPLKNMIIKEQDEKFLNDFSSPPSPLFSSPKTNLKSRPYSKSLSQVGHSEIVRITQSNLKKLGLNNNNDSLTRILSNQSFESTISSSKGFVDSNSIILFHSEDENNSLIKELGLEKPDIIHEEAANDFSSVSINRLNHHNNIVAQQIIKNDDAEVPIFSSITPTTPSTLINPVAMPLETVSRDDISLEPDFKKDALRVPKVIVNDEKTSTGDLTNDSFISHSPDENGKPKESVGSEEDEMSKIDRDEFSTDTSDFQQSNTSAFSFQPSLPSGNAGTEAVTPATKNSNNFEPYKSVGGKTPIQPSQSCNSDDTSDPSTFDKTAKALSQENSSINASIKNDEVNGSVQRRIKSDSSQSAGFRNSILFSKLNLKKNEKDDLLLDIPTSPPLEFPGGVSEENKSSASSSSPKERRSWFEKLRSRSNSKRS